MPFIRVDVAEGLPREAKRRLLRETAELFAEITGSPLERVRSQVHELSRDDFAVGGISIAESGVQAPFVTLDLFVGRPTEQHTALIERISARVAEICDVPVDRLRLRINQIDPGCWGIGGVPASVLRQREIESRSKP